MTPTCHPTTLNTAVKFWAAARSAAERLKCNLSMGGSVYARKGIQCRIQFHRQVLVQLLGLQWSPLIEIVTRRLQKGRRRFRWATCKQRALSPQTISASCPSSILVWLLFVFVLSPSLAFTPLPWASSPLSPNFPSSPPLWHAWLHANAFLAEEARREADLQGLQRISQFPTAVPAAVIGQPRLARCSQAVSWMPAARATIPDHFLPLVMPSSPFRVRGKNPASQLMFLCYSWRTKQRTTMAKASRRRTQKTWRRKGPSKEDADAPGIPQSGEASSSKTDWDWACEHLEWGAIIEEAPEEEIPAELRNNGPG